MADKKWYVIHTYSAYENKVKTAIEKGVIGTPLESLVGQVLVPVRSTFIIREGKKVEREKKLFTSYVIIEAEMTSELKTYILGLVGVTNFLGLTKDKKDPIPLNPEEVDRLFGITDREAGTPAFTFFPGDPVKVTTGPFSDFEGIIQKVADGGTKLTIEVTVFGRKTPVELNSNQVELLKK